MQYAIKKGLAKPFSKASSYLTLTLLDGHFEMETQLEEMKEPNTTFTTVAGIDITKKTSSDEVKMSKLVMPAFEEIGIDSPKLHQIKKSLGSFEIATRNHYNKIFKEFL